MTSFLQHSHHYHLKSDCTLYFRALVSTLFVAAQCVSCSSRSAGRVLEAAADFTFLLLLLLCAKGYTITRGRLRQASAVKMTVFLALYVVTWGVLFVYEQLVYRLIGLR